MTNAPLAMCLKAQVTFVTDRGDVPEGHRPLPDCSKEKKPHFDQAVYLYSEYYYVKNKTQCQHFL